MHTYTHVYIHACMHTYTYAYIHTRMYVRTTCVFFATGFLLGHYWSTISLANVLTMSQHALIIHALVRTCNSCICLATKGIQNQNQTHRAGEIRLHKYIHTHIHACMQTYIHAYIHTRMHVHEIVSRCRTIERRITYCTRGHENIHNRTDLRPLLCYNLRTFFATGFLLGLVYYFISECPHHVTTRSHHTCACADLQQLHMTTRMHRILSQSHSAPRTY